MKANTFLVSLLLLGLVSLFPFGDGVAGTLHDIKARGKLIVGVKTEQDSSRDAASLYDKLQKTIVPLFYGNCTGFIDVMLQCIALNGSFFNTHRMLQQYVANAYFL